ncbi:MAG: hypothetical protein LBL55_11700 [Propionibacteriaceae bacterium]|jgi:hypothetical protein|nr:hypothetical protein [Propionibacteriaceae bacterium]
MTTKFEFRLIGTEAPDERLDADQSPDDTVTLVGRLEKVDLRSHDFRIRDDVGNAYVLPKVTNDVAVGHLIGARVCVTGIAGRDARGRIVSVREAEVVALPDPLNGARIPESISVEEILASAPGLEPGGIPGLSDEEAEAFFAAMGM